MIYIDLRRNNLTQGFHKGITGNSEWFQPEITLRGWCGISSHAQVNVNVQYHGAERCVSVVTCSLIPKHPLPCYVTYQRWLCFPPRNCSSVIPASQSSRRHAAWDETCSLKIHVKVSVVTENHGMSLFDFRRRSNFPLI